jgi:hypothetical protein
VEKKLLKISTASVIFEKLPKVNNRPMGKKSPNLVALVPTRRFRGPALTVMRMKGGKRNKESEGVGRRSTAGPGLPAGPKARF